MSMELGGAADVPEYRPQAHLVSSMLYFTSDTHFADPRVLRIDRRPFRSVADHDEALVAKWNQVVAPDDELWHLGDFVKPGTIGIEELLSRLHGRKHLVIGNNDADDTTTAKGWASVQHYAEMLVGERLLILCHYPFRTWNKMGRKSINLHGHSHGKLKPVPRQFDVGVDAQGLHPVTIEAILGGRRRGSAAATV